MKLKVFSLLLVIALLLAGCGKEAATPAASQPDVTTEAAQASSPMAVPDFTVYNEDSQPVKLSDFLGKPVVLNFWASWCGPCKSEMPAFQKVYEELGGEVNFVMINVGEHMDEAIAFLETTDYTFPVLFDVNNDASYTYQISSIPTTFFLDAQGNLITYQVDAMEESVLRAAIDASK